jgi:hypothetical protein
MLTAPERRQADAEINTSYNDANPSISADGLRLFFNSNRPGGFGQFDLYVATRTAADAPWQQAVNLGVQVNTAYDDKGPSISPDGSLVYFHSTRSAGAGAADLYAVTVGYDVPAAPTISISDASASEGSDSALSNTKLRERHLCHVDYQTAMKRPLPADYAVKSGTLTFAPSQTTRRSLSDDRRLCHGAK